MVRLYRSPSESQHWLVYAEDLGWVRFPAKADGWNERRPATAIDRQHLCRVPLRMAFNTGLVESLERPSLDRAA